MDPKELIVKKQVKEAEQLQKQFAEVKLPALLQMQKKMVTLLKNVPSDPKAKQELDKLSQAMKGDLGLMVKRLTSCRNLLEQATQAFQQSKNNQIMSAPIEERPSQQSHSSKPQGTKKQRIKKRDFV